MAGLNRHSTIVAWVKIALPALALILLASLFLFSRTPDPDAALPLSNLDIDQVTVEQRLSEPRFASTLEDGREVIVTADSVVQSSNTTNEIVLEQVDASLQLSADDIADLVANDGLIDLITQTMSLTGDVELVTQSGYHLISDAMDISIADTLSVVSPGPVTSNGPGYQLDAGAMTLTGPEGQAVLEFTDGVRLLYDAGG